MMNAANRSDDSSQSPCKGRLLGAAQRGQIAGFSGQPVAEHLASDLISRSPVRLKNISTTGVDSRRHKKRKFLIMNLLHRGREFVPRPGSAFGRPDLIPAD